MSYLYRHIRLDKNVPFYIGIGSDDLGKYTRAYSKRSRNQHWKNVVNLTDYEIEIILDDLTWQEACENRLNISKAKSGIKLTDEHKRKISKANKNRKLTDEHKEKISKAKAKLTNSHNKTL